ncbi:MAG: DMT family transporter [Spirochaetales bacterium]
MKERYVTMLLALSMVCAGSNVVTGKLLAGKVDVFTIGFVSLGMALLALLPAQLKKRAELRRLSPSDLLHVGMQSLFGIVLYRVLTIVGLTYSQALDAAVILSTTPAVITLLAMIALRERPTPRRMVAIGLAVAAALVVNLAEAREPNVSSAEAAFLAPERLLGNLLILGAVLCEALMTIVRRHSGTRVSHVTNTTLMVATGFLFFAVAGLVRGFSFEAITLPLLGLLAVFGLVGTAVGYLLWGYGAARVPATTTGVVLGILPLTAIALGVAILGEPLTAANVIGALLGLGGLLLVGLGGRTAKPAAKVA